MNAAVAIEPPAAAGARRIALRPPREQGGPDRRYDHGPYGPRPMTEPTENVTRLLHAVSGGDRQDLDALMSAIYDDLRRLAVGHMRAERANHTLQPTAVVHEAYMRLIDQRSTSWKDRVHFFAVASRIIRRILVDHARERLALKRGGAAERMSLEHVELAGGVRDGDILALDEAMGDLADLSERQARIVELRFFGGLTIDEIAEVLEIGKRSVDREWKAAKAWLYVRLHDEPGPGDGD